MTVFNTRMLKYESTARRDKTNPDYGTISKVINDKLINVDMGGSNYTLEAVGVEGGYIPKFGDWVLIEWKNGNPVAKGNSTATMSSGLSDINTPTIVSQSDLANGTINGDHIRSESIDTNHIVAGSITTNQLSANSITSTLIQANAVQTQHISANSISGGQIQANAITSQHIQAGSISGNNIASNTITAVNLSANSVTSYQISANSIQTQHISANSIQTNQIQTGAITTALLSANSITSDKIQAGAISAISISANSITTDKLVAGSITSTLISSNAVQTQHISANSIEGFQIQENQVSANHITANAINATHISANQIQSQHISANTITTPMLQANIIQAQNISANAIQTQHISSNTIATNQIQAGSITSTLISANSIQSQHISSNSITSAMIQAGAITSNLITANAITSTQIASDAIQSIHISANQINAYHISANQVTAIAISSNSIQSRHISSNTIDTSMIQANAITTNLITANAITSMQISSNQIMGYHISANQISGNMIVASAIQSQHISANTINAGMMQANSVTTNAISANSVTTNQISSNSIQSRHISANTIQGYMIQANQISANMITANAINATHISSNSILSNMISANQVQTQHISANSVQASQISANSVQTQHISANSIVGSQIQASQISANHIVSNSITATQMKVGTITASSGILASASVGTANIISGSITNALIGNEEVTTAKIASGNITNALIANATIDHSKIASVDAGTITVGSLNGSIITAGTISGNQIAAQTITGDRLVAGTIDTTQLKAGSVVTNTIASGAITTDKIEAGAVTGDIIRAGSITAQHISTVGLDAQLVQVYDSKTGETLVGSGYLRVDGLDVGVVQSDNLLQNGLFLTSSFDYGFKRMNPSGEALLGNTVTGVGSHQVWKINLASGNTVKTIDIPSKKPFDIAIHPTGNYAYITVQGDNTLAQLDLSQDILVSSGNLNMNVGPARIEYFGGMLGDMKHMFVLNTDPSDMHIPDSLMVVDTPPDSVNGDFYVHHEIVLGNNPYDLVMDDMMTTYVTMASEGDIVAIDNTSTNSFNWKVKGRIPISAYGTDNNHGDLPSTVGLNEVVGGSASGQYNDNSMSSSMSGMGGMDTPSGYGTSDGSLRTYEPHGIVQSSDSDTLYVVDYANGELVVVDKYGNAPYNALIGTTASGSFQGSGDTTGSSPASLGMTESMGGGPGTYYVRYRFPVGDSPDFIQLVNGKLFISLEGSGKIAVIDESAILNEINSDKSYYGTKNTDGSFSNWSFTQPMRTVNVPTVRYINNVGNEPSIMKVNMMDNHLYVSVSGDGKVVKIDTSSETVVQTISVGTNPKGFDFTPDGMYMYVANYGGIGDLSFIYPNGNYVGDPFMALEGGIMYQGADGWTPDRSDWTYDSSGNIQSKSTVEFHINEPLKNEGGYAKLTSFGIDNQYAQIEQDIVNVENYSNGNNTVIVSGGRLNANIDNTVFTPREGTFVSGSVSNINIASIVSGNTILTSANVSQYTINYGTSQILFSSNAVASGNWVQADYTSPNNIYFKTHNSSVEIAVDNGSSPNFATSFQVDEFVPNFVAVDNRQTSSFTPTADGISTQYEGLYYSTMTNQALNMPSANISSSSSLQPSHNNLLLLTDGDTTSANYIAISGVSGGSAQYMKVDLGSTYMIGQINVWHYWSDGRTYHNTKTEVSEDGNNWTTIFDSAVSGEYAETSGGRQTTFNALPVRYIRDWTNGSTSNYDNHWVEIQALGDWQVNYSLTYPSNSTKAGQQIATNGKGFVQTSVPKAYVSMNIPINFTSWWWMTYIVGPQFGRIKIEMPTLMKSGHFLNQQSPFINNVAHRHIMSFPPSMMIQADSMNNIESGKHRVIIRQDSGTVTLDRLRFDDYQYYNRSTLSIPSQSSPATFTRYKVIAQQAQWYQGKGRQSTEGAYDTPRTNPDTGNPDYSVPIKYRVRVLSQLSPTGNTQERGTIYVTSAIFETGKQSTHWRRSEASDVFAGNKIETWNPSQPMSTGIQSAHLADGAVRASKILPNAIYDYHVSNYARIQEHKLELNYPTHNHTNKSVLDTIVDWAGTSGNYGTGNVMARGDHSHDGKYLSLASGGQVNALTTFTHGTNSQGESHFSNGTYVDPAVGQGFALKVSQGIATDKVNVSGNITVTGNVIITGTVDGADISVMSGNLYSHIGSGGSAHPVAVSGGANGFIDGANYAKLLNIQSNAINQTTADSRYYIKNQTVMLSSDNIAIGADTSSLRMGFYKKAGYAPAMAVTSGNSFVVYEINTSDLTQNISGTTVMNNLLDISSSSITYKGNGIWHSANLSDPATKTWISGNYYNSSTVDTKLNSKGDVFQSNANTFTNTNIFNNAGLSIKIQPSGSVTNSTNLLQVNDASSNQLFYVNYSGGVYVAGDLTVVGQTKYTGTTQVDGDYHISGNLFVSGNSTLGNTNTDTTTVNGTLVVNGAIQEVGYYQEVNRRPLFGIAGDLQFQTNSITFDNVVDFYDLTRYGNPTVQTGATRYYRIYAIYSDDINGTQASGGQQTTLRIAGSTNKDLVMDTTWGSVNGRRDWYSPYFTDLPTGNGNIQVMLAQSGNNVGIRWIELIAYDKF